MKNLVLIVSIAHIFIFMTSGFQISAQENPSSEYMEVYRGKMDRTNWFRHDRFGMFIHFGAYAVPARGEWVKTNEQMTNEEYKKYVDAFVPSNYDPSQWAKLAKQAGMKYAVMTAKHHDGFCLFDSKATDYKISKNLPGRDFMKEFSDAFRAEGLKVGFYYSLIDWHHEDYPNVGNHPMRNNKAWDEKAYDWDAYLKYMHKQIEELMTNYGKIDILWLDYSFDEYNGEKWKAAELIKMIRKYQPDIILNSRLEQSAGNSLKGRAYGGYGDFETPEQGIPESGLKDLYGNAIPWETCLTLNNNWGYAASDHEWKSSKLIIHSLVDAVSKNGNLLLNVGPDAQGNIPMPSQQILKEVGAWMQKNSESIYGCGNSELLKPEWGYFTQKGRTVFAHWTNPKIGYINIKGYADKVETVSLLASGEEATTATRWWGNEDVGNFFINIKEPVYHTFQLPDETNTVFKIILR